MLAFADPSTAVAPDLVWIWPFAGLLLAIAILPLIEKAAHWWHSNTNKLIVALTLAAVTLGYYYLRGFGLTGDGHVSEAGLPTVFAVLHHAVLDEYIPFMTLLFALYVVSGGIVVRGDVRATPLTNTTILSVGGLLASFIGTTGASMVLIRFLLRTNSERHNVVHTVIFFIFIVSNCGGLLLPTGDPPLFLGYLQGVPFFWTLRLWPEWLITMVCLLAIYFVWDSIAWRREKPSDKIHDRLAVEPLRIAGAANLAWLILVVTIVALLDPEKHVPFTEWAPPPHLREGLVLFVVAAAWLTTNPALRVENKFTFFAIAEVACLFIGIFITMQTPLEILRLRGGELHVSHPWQFFWASGGLSSFLDNAPTYVVFLELAKSLTHAAGPGVIDLIGGGHVREDLLIAVSLGSVFMGANTYIGNGPNFMVKSIADEAGVKMPSFFGYMAYSGVILIPLFAALTFIFFRAG